MGKGHLCWEAPERNYWGSQKPWTVESQFRARYSRLIGRNEVVVPAGEPRCRGVSGEVHSRRTHVAIKGETALDQKNCPLPWTDFRQIVVQIWPADSIAGQLQLPVRNLRQTRKRE